MADEMLIREARKPATAIVISETRIPQLTAKTSDDIVGPKYEAVGLEICVNETSGRGLSSS